MDTDTSNGHAQYTTSRGHVLQFNSIAPLLDKLEAWRIENTPKPPTYTPLTAPGFMAQPIPHHFRIVKAKELDESGNETGREIDKEDTSLESPEDWAAWRAYQNELARVQREYGEKFLKTVLLRGLNVEMPTDDAWVREQEFMGYTVPTEPLQRKLYWLETEVFSTKEEIEDATTRVLRASGTREEVISAMEASFRGDVGRRATERTPETNSNGAHSRVLDNLATV